jgi:excisionase family DNA binding protein
MTVQELGDEVLDSEQAAAYLGVNVATYREKVRAGKYPGSRLAGTGPLRVLRSELDAFVAGRWEPTDG